MIALCNNLNRRPHPTPRDSELCLPLQLPLVINSFSSFLMAGLAAHPWGPSARFIPCLGRACTPVAGLFPQTQVLSMVSYSGCRGWSCRSC